MLAVLTGLLCTILCVFRAGWSVLAVLTGLLRTILCVLGLGGVCWLC